MDRVDKYILLDPRDGHDCWEWTAAKVSGYGRIGIPGKGKSALAYRVIYEALVGPVPKGLQLDHLCRNRACVNPAHLEPVTQRENFRRSPLMNGAKVMCIHGHAFDPENTHIDKRGRRHCRACHAERERQRRKGE